MAEYKNELRVFCETLPDPIGIDNPAPRFSWHPIADRALAPQKSYRISVSLGDKCVWDSGLVDSSRSTAVEYEGEALVSFAKYSYTVLCTLTDGSLYTGYGSFEMGILSEDEWCGEFLCHPSYEKRCSPVFVMKPNFDGEIASARAYFCGLGLGELYINGVKTDDSLVDPAWTDYTRRVLYRTFDVTGLLRSGENKLRVLLGDGWMAHNHRYFEQSRKPPLPWYHEPCFLLNLRVEYKDGRIENYAPTVSDCFANFSEISAQNLFDGEIYDARRAKALAEEEKGDLSQTDGWVAPAVTEIKGVRTSQIMPPIKMIESFTPIRVASTDPTTYTVDMGLNFAGLVRIRVKGSAGSEIKLSHAEVIRDDDTLNRENLRCAEASDTYILSGDPSGESYMPRFTYHGFRFVEIKISGRAQVLDVVGIRVNTAVERIARFECDDPMLCRIYNMLINTEMNNIHSLPTDCPQRDERLAWLNDVMMRLEQNVMNFDSQLLFEKWLNDMRDTQEKMGSGAVPDTCPYFYGMNPARWNASVFVALPYALYTYYGDIQPMKRHWKSVLWFMKYQKSKLTDEGLINEYFVGEWCPPMKDSILEDKQSAFAREIKNQLATSCFYYLECRICEMMAKLLSDGENEKSFALRAANMRDAINAKYYSFEKGTYLPECQGNVILPLRFGIVPDGEEGRVAEKLISYIVKKDNYHMSTGSHTTRFLFECLSMIGRNDVALRMLHVKDYPSFGYMLENGATSLWERWEKSFGFMTSHNHPMSGGFGVWFFKALGGFLFDGMSGRLTVAPRLPEGIDSVSCERSIRGSRLASRARRLGGVVVYDVEIPWNTSAEIRVIAGEGSVTVNGKDIEKTEYEHFFSEGMLILKCSGGYLNISVEP